MSQEESGEPMMVDIESDLDLCLSRLSEEVNEETIEKVLDVVLDVLSSFETGNTSPEMSKTLLILEKLSKVFKPVTRLQIIENKLILIILEYSNRSLASGLRESSRLLMNLVKQELLNEIGMGKLTDGIIQLIENGKENDKKKVEYLIKLLLFVLREERKIRGFGFFSFGLRVFKSYQAWDYRDEKQLSELIIGLGIETEMDLIFSELIRLDLLEVVQSYLKKQCGFLKLIVSSVDTSELKLDEKVLKLSTDIISKLSSEDFDEFISDLVDYLFAGWTSFHGIEFVRILFGFVKGICPDEIREELALVFGSMDLPWWIRLAFRDEDNFYVEDSLIQEVIEKVMEEGEYALALLILTRSKPQENNLLKKVCMKMYRNELDWKFALINLRNNSELLSYFQNFQTELSKLKIDCELLLKKYDFIDLDDLVKNLA